MSKEANQGRARIFTPWDGKSTGPRSAVTGVAPPSRHYSWNSVKKNQGRMFTIEEVEKIVAKAVAAVRGGREVPPIEQDVKEEEIPEEEFVIGGK